MFHRTKSFWLKEPVHNTVRYAKKYLKLISPLEHLTYELHVFFIQFMFFEFVRDSVFENGAEDLLRKLFMAYRFLIRFSHGICNPFKEVREWSMAQVMAQCSDLKQKNMKKSLF